MLLPKKYPAYISVIMLVILLPVFGLLNDFFSREAENNFKKEFNTAIDNLKFLFPGSSLRDSALFANYINRYGKQYDLSVFTIDSAGKAKAISQGELFDSSFFESTKNNRAENFINYYNDSILYSYIRINEIEDNSLRYLLVTRALNSLHAKTGRITFFMIISLIIIISALIAFSYLWSRRHTKRITDLYDYTEKIKNGARDIYLKTSGNDEISHLSTALNGLTAKISDEFKTLKKLEKVRSEFLGNVSHELKTPIFSIQGYIETLKDGALNEPEINTDFLDRIEKHAERLNSLVSDLIEISKIESGELKLSYRFFNLQEFLRGVVDELHSLAVSNNINIKFDCKTNSQILVFADRERIRQVMTNLIENAIKYNKPGGEVTVEAKTDHDQAMISVADTGIGIDEEHHSRIFERFYRIDKNRSREIGGTGLGLAIVKHIIEAHKGTITIESKVGYGSRFSFPLPTKVIS